VNEPWFKSVQIVGWRFGGTMLHKDLRGISPATFGLSDFGSGAIAEDRSIAK
jgi:hypothetical protein